MSHTAHNHDLVCAECGVDHPSDFCPLNFRDDQKVSPIDGLISFSVVGFMLIGGTVGSYLIFDALL